MPRRTLPSKIGRSASGRTPRDREVSPAVLRISLQHDDIAHAQHDGGKALGDTLALAARQRQEIDIETVIERQLLRRPAYQVGILADDRLEGRGRLLVGFSVAAAGDAQPRLGDDAVERLMRSLRSDIMSPSRRTASGSGAIRLTRARSIEVTTTSPPPSFRRSAMVCRRTRRVCDDPRFRHIVLNVDGLVNGCRGPRCAEAPARRKVRGRRCQQRPRGRRPA